MCHYLYFVLLFVLYKSFIIKCLTIESTKVQKKSSFYYSFKNTHHTFFMYFDFFSKIKFTSFKKCEKVCTFCTIGYKCLNINILYSTNYSTNQYK